MKKRVILFLAIILTLALAVSLVACAQVVPYEDWVLENLLNDLDDAPLNQADVRIMSSNLLVEIWEGPPVEPRSEMYRELLKAYKPDVVAIQEMSNGWYDNIQADKPDNYSFVKAAEKNFTNMIYNTDTVTLIDEGFEMYSKHNDFGGMRGYAYGVFKLKSTGKKFAVTSTHWDYGMEQEKIEMRDAQISELSAAIADIRAKHDCPVFAAGDYNVDDKDKKNGAESYDKFIGETNMKDAEFTADNSVIIPDKFFEELVWDHIFYHSDTAHPLAFNSIYGHFAKVMSDHYPIYADFKLL